MMVNPWDFDSSGIATSAAEKKKDKKQSKRDMEKSKLAKSAQKVITTDSVMMQKQPQAQIPQVNDLMRSSISKKPTSLIEDYFH